MLRITAVVLALAVWASVSFVLFDRISGDPEVAAPVDTVVDGGDAGPPADVVLAGAATDEDDAGVTPPVVIAGTVEGPREPSGSSVLEQATATIIMMPRPSVFDAVDLALAQNAIKGSIKQVLLSMVTASD